MEGNLLELGKLVFLSPLQVGVIELPFTLLDLLLQLLLPVIGISFFYKIFLKMIRRVVEKSRLKEELKERIERWMYLLFRGIFVFLVFLLSSRLLGAKILEYLKAFYGILNQPLIQSGSNNITFITILFTIPVFYLASWAGKASRKLVNRSLLSRVGLDEAQQFSMASLLRYTVMVLVLLIGLSIIGINLSALTVIFGVLGIGLGFGLQSVVSNFFSGLVIIISRPVKEGDRILVNDFEGDIVQIRLISTVINTIANENIIIPNSHLVGNAVHNLSYNNPSIIIRNDIGVSYHSDVDQVLEVLNTVALKNPFRIPSKSPFIRLKEFGDSSINFAVFTWICHNINKYEAHHWNNVEIWRALKDNGIEIPFPQMDLHVRK